MDAASKLGYFVAGLLVGGSLGVLGMWLAYDAGRLIQGIKDDAQNDEADAEASNVREVEKPKREEPGYIRRLKEEERGRQ